MTVVLLSAVLAGQCSGGRCPAPAQGFGPGYLPAPVFVQPAPAALPAPQVEGRDYYVVRRHRVTHDGLTFEVEGYVNGRGNVVWEPTREFNRRSRDAAQAEHARLTAGAAVAKRPDRAPGAEPGPRPATGQLPSAALNFGLNPERMSRDRDTYKAKGDEARRFVREAKAPAGASQKLHVTVIGPDGSRAPVVGDLKTHPAFEGLRDSLLVQGYKPGEWAVDPSLGFQAGGAPSIVVQAARCPSDPRGGRVVYRADRYEGPERLAEAIRKADPNYRPNLDPGPGNPGPGACPLGFTRDHWPIVAAVAAVVLLFARLPRKAA
jgi:hypothetical protein